MPQSSPVPEVSRQALRGPSLLGSLFALLCYRALLDLAYVFYIIPHGFWPYTLAPALPRILMSVLLDIAIYLCLPRARDRLSSACLGLLFALAVVPLHSLYAMMGVAETWVLVADAGFLLTIFVVRAVPVARLGMHPNGRKATLLGSALCALGTYGGLAATIGVPTLAAARDLYDSVYAVRSTYSALASGLLPYVVSWQGTVINPFWTGLAAVRRKYVWLLVPIGLQVLLYLYTGTKASLLACPLVLLLGFLVRRRAFLRNLLACLAAGVVLSLVLVSLGAPDIIPDLGIRRMLFTPAMNSSLYYDFFSVHPQVQWSHSILSGVVANPYGQNPVYMMGQITSGTAFSMNVGYLADGYMNLGIAGVLFMSLLLGAVLVLLDSLARRVSLPVAVAVIAVPIWSLVDSALLTTLATHGLLLGAVILWLFGAPQGGAESESRALRALPTRAESAPTQDGSTRCLRAHQIVRRISWPIRPAGS